MTKPNNIGEFRNTRAMGDDNPRRLEYCGGNGCIVITDESLFYVDLRNDPQRFDNLHDAEEFLYGWCVSQCYANDTGQQHTRAQYRAVCEGFDNEFLQHTIDNQASPFLLRWHYDVMADIIATRNRTTIYDIMVNADYRPLRLALIWQASGLKLGTVYEICEALAADNTVTRALTDGDMPQPVYTLIRGADSFDNGSE